MQLIILDRDGVINVDSGAPVATDLEWRAIPGSLEAIARLNGAGYRVVVASNQPSLRRKTLSIEMLNAIHHKMQQELLEAGGSVDAVFFCPCLPRDACDCMMPRPGMLLEIASRLRITLDNVPVIGASMESIEAADAAGARPIYVRSGALEAGQFTGLRTDIERYDNLAAAAESLLGQDPPA